jgi:hypothetical protein
MKIGVRAESWGILTPESIQNSSVWRKHCLFGIHQQKKIANFQETIPDHGLSDTQNRSPMKIQARFNACFRGP